MSTEQHRPWIESYPDDVPLNVDTRQYRNLYHLFVSVCRTYERRTAYISLESSITFGQLAKDVDAFSAYLQTKLGLKKGDRLAVIMPNLIQYPIAVFGALKAGLVVVNINPLYTPREMQGVLKDSKATAVVAFEQCAKGLLEVKNETCLKHIIVTSLGDKLGPVKGAVFNFVLRYLKKAVPHYNRQETISFSSMLKEGRSLPLSQPLCTYDDLAFLQYTGGTTGSPKGAMLSHGNILSNIAQILGMYGMVLRAGQEVILTPLPLYHIFSMTVNLFFAFTIAATNILVVDPRRIRTLGRIMGKHPEISAITGVNTLYHGLLLKGIFDRVKLPNLKLAVAGGAAIQSGVAERFFNATGQHLLEGYGLTECSPVVCVNPHTDRVFNGSIGIPVPNTLARIIDGNGKEIWELNTPGELEFKGPQVMLGYYNNEKDNAAVRDGEWIRTGDVAVWLEGGYLKIIDRIKDMILVSGFNVFPSEIEDVVSHNKRVAECACVGVPSEATGEAIKLFVVKKDETLSEDELKDYCRIYLTGYKMPKIIEFVSRLPKSPVGKVMRRYLKQNRITD